MPEYESSRREPNIRIATHDVSVEPRQETISSQEARALLEEAVRAIPDEQLDKFRGAAVTVIM